MLRVRVLGGLEIECDGEALELPLRRPARLLLGWLAVHPGAHARSTVAGRLWPAVRDDSARMSLRSALTALRAALGPGVAAALAADRERIGLVDASVDLAEFERLRTSEPERALDVCRGELLAGFDDEWVLIAREEHRARVGELLAALADRAADPVIAVGLARRRASLDPLDEAAYRDLMRRHARAGDRAAALAAYERLRERLLGELGVAPSGATRALAAELRTDDPTAAPVRPAPLPARIVAARRRGPLVGRGRELARLRAMWSRAGTDGRIAVVVTGEPGIGKTRLVAELAAEVHAQGAVVLYGRAEEEALVPYEPIVACLPAEASIRRLPRTGRGQPGDELPGARAHLFDGVGAALDDAAGRAPALLVLDDLHWAERPTMRLVAYLAARTGGAPQVLLATFRETEAGGRERLADALSGLRRELPVEVIALEGLDEEGVAAMAAAAHAPAVDPAALRARTGGNPFFVQEVLRSGPGGTLDGLAVDAVARRVEALGPGAGSVLTAGALAGPEFDHDLVADVVGLPTSEVLDVLDVATRARLLVEVPGEPGRFAFAHAIVRDALGHRLTAARRARLHGLLADTLEERAREDPDRYLVALANHALEAAAGGGDPDRAAALAERAAERAGSVLAYEDAAEMLRRAVAALERRGVGGARRAEVLCSLGEALRSAGEVDEAREALERAGELARIAGRPDITAQALLASGGVGVTILGVDEVLVARLEECAAALAGDDPRLGARLHARLAIELAYGDDPARQRRAARTATDLARLAAEPGVLAEALGARHVALWGPDHADERLAIAGEMLELGRRAGDPALMLQARNWRVTDLMETGDGDAMRAELAAYAALSAELRLPGYSWWVPLWGATLALLDGRVAEGMELSRRAREQGDRAGDANAEVLTAQHRLMKLMIDRRFDEIDPAAIGAGDPVEERATRSPAARAYRFTFSWVHAERGETDLARANLAAAVGDGLGTLPRDANWSASVFSATHAAVLLGEVGLMRELGDLLAPFADGVIVAARGSCHAGAVAYLLGRLAVAGGDASAAAGHFAHAVRVDERAGARIHVLRDGAALDAARAQARDPAREAHEDAEAPRGQRRDHERA